MNIHRNVNGRLTKQVYKGNLVLHLVEPATPRHRNLNYPLPNYTYVNSIGNKEATGMALYAVERLIK